MTKLKKPSIGWYFLLASFLCCIVAFALFLSTYSVFRYETNRWAVSCMILSIWGLLFLLVNTLWKGDYPSFCNVIYGVVTFLILFAFTQFINPCLSPIGIYFTVHNMGDVATNAIGVPRAIIASVFFILATCCTMIAAFLSPVRKEKEV